MQEKFDIELQQSWVVELDSTSATKFSRHVIIQVPGAAFRSNFHVGAFVKDLCEAPSNVDCPGSDKTARQELLVAKARSMHVLRATSVRSSYRVKVVSAVDAVAGLQQDLLKIC